MNFQIRQRVLSLGHVFSVQDDENNYGVIDQKIWHATRTFDYKHEDGTTIARAQPKVFSWGTQIVVTDPKGNMIGTIKEDVWASGSHPYSKYEILNARGDVVATSKKEEAFTTDFDIYGNTGDHIANIHRGFNWIKDKWEVTLFKPAEIDPRVLVMIPAYKTAADEDHKEEERKEEDDERKSNRK